MPIEVARKNQSALSLPLNHFQLSFLSPLLKQDCDASLFLRWDWPMHHKKMNSVIQHQVVDEMSLDTSEGFEFLRNTTEN